MKSKFIEFLNHHPFWTFIIGCVIILIVPSIFSASFGLFPSYANTGQIGDTIGGITAPFIGLFSALLIYYSFKAQIAANEQLAEYRKSDIVEKKYIYVARES